MISSRLLWATLVVIFAVMCTGRLSAHVRPALRSAIKPIIRNGARQGRIVMSNNPAKSEGQTVAPDHLPPGLSDMRVTYKLTRDEIQESNVGVTQSIDDHWCADFNLPSVPFGCSCWRYEYLAYFCVDWSCVNGHSSDFAMCQFLNVSWPIDPPRRSSAKETALIGGIQSVLKILAGYLPVKRGNDTSLAQKLLALGQVLQGESKP